MDLFLRNGNGTVAVYILPRKQSGDHDTIDTAVDIKQKHRLSTISLKEDTTEMSVSTSNSFTTYPRITKSTPDIHCPAQPMVIGALQILSLARLYALGSPTLKATL